MYTLLHVLAAKQSSDETTTCLVANEDSQTFAQQAATQICAYLRSDCTDDECADNKCMHSTFEGAVAAELKPHLTKDLPPRIMYSLSMFLSHPLFQDVLWVRKDPDRTQAVNCTPSFPLMRRATTHKEETMIREAIASGENVEETIFDVGSQTRTWTVVHESPPTKLNFFDKPRGFSPETPELQAHIDNIKDRGLVPRVQPPGTHILNI